jgi:hypothetical protein
MEIDATHEGDTTMTKNYAVINYIAGYMPDNYDEGYPSRKDAERAAVETARRWREDEWIVKGNARTGYVAYRDAESRDSAYSLPTYIEVIEMDGPPSEDY